MKFIKTFLACLVICFAFTFFALGLIINHVYFGAVLAAIVIAAVICFLGSLFRGQDEKIAALEKRCEALEKQLSGTAFDRDAAKEVEGE